MKPVAQIIRETRIADKINQQPREQTMGQPPVNRVIFKEPEDTQWIELIVGWKLANSQNCSVKINVKKIIEVAKGADTIKALLVPNTPRPASNSNEPTRSAPRRRATGPRPAA